jgi:hypothetical protein
MGDKTKPAVEETIIVDANIQLEELKLKIQEKSEFLTYRRQWSRYLLYLLVVIVVFNSAFLVAVGRGLLTFKDEWLVRIVFAGSFVEVLGLAKIVVDFLFKDPPKT